MIIIFKAAVTSPFSLSSQPSSSSDFFHFFNPVSFPCSQPGSRMQLFQPDEHILQPARRQNARRRLLWETRRNRKAAKRVFWNPTKTYHFSDFFHFLNPISLPCSQPGGRMQLFQPDQHIFQPARRQNTRRRLLWETRRNRKAAKRVFWNLTKAYHFSDTFHFFNSISLPCSQPGGRTQLFQLDEISCCQPGYLLTLRHGKPAKPIFWDPRKPSICSSFPFFSTPIALLAARQAAERKLL